MVRKVQHSLLTKAKTHKNDEFYTQRSDIERELCHYKDHFKDKVVFCNCDDPRVSNFYRYFAENFEEMGLKKLIAACYTKQDFDLFNYENPEPGYFYEFIGSSQCKVGPASSDLKRFSGDGDFRSAESIELLKESDIVVTNPPFSLFREFVAQLVAHDKQFLIIGNINAITYKEIFKLIQADKAWLGANLGRGISGFIVPEHYELYGTEARIDEHGNRIVSPNNCLWLTNLEYLRRREYIELTRTYSGNESDYPEYDNYVGINVNRTKDIPKDFAGHMGVPITFLHKHNPDQFEIIKFRKGDDDKDLAIGGKCPYFRILIRNRNL